MAYLDFTTHANTRQHLLQLPILLMFIETVLETQKLAKHIFIFLHFVMQVILFYIKKALRPS